VTLPALLALEDGTIFEGVSVGAPGLSVGEVVFNTAMTGYQEILTDPSYARQLVTLTYPHIGNTGCTDQDDEARQVWAAGLIVRDILIIGAGPIVIGQACEFDYSGTQACKALKEEGYRIVLVNSNPGHDHDRSGSGRRDLYRADHAGDRRQDHREGAPRPRRALLPTMGGQTALNCALSLRKHGHARQVRRRDDRRHREAIDKIDKAEDRELFREAMTKIGLETPRSHPDQDAAARRCEARARRHRPARDHPALLHAGRHRRRHRLQQGEFIEIVERGIDASPTTKC
jgi:carbamoyl-phosphate synthase large subunit